MALWNNPYLLLLLTTAMWGGNAVASRSSPGHISPMVLTSGRWAIALVIIAVVFGKLILRERSAMMQHWKGLFIYGVTGFLLFNVFAYIAGNYTTAVNIGIIQGTIPFFVLLGAYLVYRAPVTALQTLGLAISLIGLLVLASEGEWHVLKAMRFNVGDVLMVVASLVYSIYTILLRQRPPLNAFAFFAGCAMAGCLASLPLLAGEIWLGKAVWPDMTGWWILVYCAVFPSILSQIFFVRGVELIGPGRAGLFVNLLPVWASVFGPLLLGEAFLAYHAVALVLVLGGIAVAEWGKPRLA